MSQILVLAFLGFVVWLYLEGYLLAVLIVLAAAIGGQILHEEMGPFNKKALYGIPIVCAIALGMVLWLMQSRWYICVGGALFLLGASTQKLWVGKGLGRLRTIAWVLLGVTVVCAFGLSIVSKGNLKKDERLVALENAFSDNRGSVQAEGFTFIKNGDPISERFPAPILFAWVDGSGKDGNKTVRFNINEVDLSRYYLSDESVSEIKTVVIAVKHMTVSKGVVTSRSGGKNYGHYEHDYDYSLYFFNIDTKEWTELDDVKNGRSTEYRGVNCNKRDAVRFVREMYQ